MDVRRWLPHVPTLLAGILIGVGGTFAFQKIYARPLAPTAALSSVLKLEIQDQHGNSGRRGTGFVIGPGLVATAHHVIVDGPRLIATDWSDQVYVATELVAADRESDVAIVRFPTCKLPAMNLASTTSQLAPGTSTLLVGGHPEGGRGTVVEGLLASIDHRSHDIRKTTELYITATTAPGSSGSPVFDPDSGKVMGIATRYKPGENLCIAASIEALTATQEQPGFNRLPNWANPPLNELLNDPKLGSTPADYNRMLSYGRYDEMLDLASQVFKAHRRNPEANSIVGDCFLRLRRWSEAVPFYKRAAELSPKEGLHWYNYALACFHVEDYEQALEPARRAFECSPDISSRHFLYAFLMDMNLETEEATDVLEKANLAFNESLTFEKIFGQLKGDE